MGRRRVPILLLLPLSSYIQVHSHTDMATQVERCYSGYWSHSDEADLLIPHKSITSSAPSNGRERGWWRVCSSVSITVSLRVQGDYFAELAAMEDTTQDQILEPLICKRWIDGKSLCSTSLTLLQQKATVIKMIHFFEERGGISVLQHTKKDTDLMEHSIRFPSKKMSCKKVHLPKNKLWNTFKMHLRMVTITFLRLLSVAAIRMK